MNKNLLELGNYKVGDIYIYFNCRNKKVHTACFCRNVHIAYCINFLKDKVLGGGWVSRLYQIYMYVDYRLEAAGGYFRMVGGR